MLLKLDFHKDTTAASNQVLVTVLSKNKKIKNNNILNLISKLFYNFVIKTASGLHKSLLNFLFV